MLSTDGGTSYIVAASTGRRSNFGCAVVSHGCIRCTGESPRCQEANKQGRGIAFINAPDGSANTRIVNGIGANRIPAAETGQLHHLGRGQSRSTTCCAGVQSNSCQAETVIAGIPIAVADTPAMNRIIPTHQSANIAATTDATRGIAVTDSCRIGIKGAATVTPHQPANVAYSTTVHAARGISVADAGCAVVVPHKTADITNRAGHATIRITGADGA